MRKILITGGTKFVSRSLAEYFVEKGDEVFVLNRNNHPQPQRVNLIEADRYALGDSLRSYQFDVVLDANSYTGEEVDLLLDALSEVNEYIFISTSAVYPETLSQPFKETQEVGPNTYWGSYGTNKIEAEKVLAKRVPQAYILRPAYIYGPHDNIYREAFVFDCAKEQRPFYLPQKGEQGLQFIHIHDICRLVDAILTQRPTEKIYNVGNEEMVSIKDWVMACYKAVGETPIFKEVPAEIPQTKYFSFPTYQYQVDVARQTQLIGNTIDLNTGLKESFEWYQKNEDVVTKRNYLEFIKEELEK